MKVGAPATSPATASQVQLGFTSPSKPMISTVARPISPVLAETPIARPSAKLCRPIATAMVMPVRRAFERALSSRGIIAACSMVIASVAPPAIDQRQTGAPPGEADGEERGEAGGAGQAAATVVELVHGVLDDLDAVHE